MNRLLALVTVALASVVGAGAFAQPSPQELPKPSPLTQKELDQKGISYTDWFLFHGIRSGNLDWVAAAIKSGADLNKARNPIGDLPPLMVAVSTPAAKAEMITLLVKHGVDVNRRWTPKSAAAGQGSGSFPLYQAARFSNPEAVEALIKHGADVKARTGNGSTALHNTFDVEIGRVLQRHGAEINARNNAGLTPMAIARRALAQLDRQPNPQLRPKVAAFHAWLKSQGGVE